MAHPKPVARGPETAIVSGPAEEVIHTDKYGRVKVRFNWDRSGSQPDKSTCFIRVSHEAAGAGFGTLYLPRIGQEVIVDFLSGDPDRPLITGRVYNASNMPLTTLPDNKTLSGWRTQTIGQAGAYDGAENPPGSGPGYNLLTMDDKGGSELMDIHAQRDRHEWVRLDDDEKVGRDQTKRVGRDRTTSVKNNETFTLDEGDEKHTVTKGKRTTEIQQNDELTVVQGDVKTTVDTGNMTIAVSTGNYSLKTDVGGVTIEATTQIQLKCGPSSIVIDPTGVTIKGMMITVQAQTLGEFDGGAMGVVKGAIVMIN
jgi:type VI secretion system secreted protein VgrG